MAQDINKHATQIGMEIFKRIHAEQASVTSFNKWTREIIQWCMSNPEVKTRVLRFVDVLPTLTTDKAVIEHIRDYFSITEARLPMALRTTSLITRTPFTGRALAHLTRHMVTEVAKQFICGESIQDALRNLATIEEKKMVYTIDILGEKIASIQEANRHKEALLTLIDQLPPQKNVSIKLSALTPYFDPISFERTVSDILERLIPIVLAARKKHTFINIDAERYIHRDITLEVVRRLLKNPDVRGYPHLGMVFQTYFKDTPQKLDEFLDWIKEVNQPFTVRLVKGAYWDSEVAEAKANRWPIPVWTEKAQTDAQFERCVGLMMSQPSFIRVAIGSHNVRSLSLALALKEKLSYPSESFETQFLYGMADPLKAAVRERGITVRVYSPYGPLIPGMAYLVRRILENTSNESFLKLDLLHEVNEKELLKEPLPPALVENPIPDKVDYSVAAFRNESPLDFSRADIRSQFKEAIEHVQTHLGAHYRLTINGKKIDTSERIQSVNPAHPKTLIGTVAKAEWKDAEEAINACKSATKDWSEQPAQSRAACLFRAATIMRERRMELAAWEILEAGKTWREADTDVTEAIDFLDYYARAMIEIDQQRVLPQVPGESNLTQLQGRGVVAVIAPWNFPLAILTGMTSAALVTGNAVIVKPAVSTGVLASHMVDILLDAGIPPSVLSFLPGSGTEIGKGLVQHPEIDMIAFTGSKEVGLSIIQEAGRTPQGQANVKKVIAEMGGKNAIIIDADADLDEAISGVLSSAFGYQGQKCSAASRLIILDEVYQKFIERLMNATQSLILGDPTHPHVDMGPVIDSFAYKKIKNAIHEGNRESRLIFQGRLDHTPKDGYFIPPTMFTTAPLNGSLSLNEIFGPVLTIFRANNFEQALFLGNHTEFGLTAGLYSRNLKNIETAKRTLAAGNIYINRKITGAMVGRHPFGGFRMSGTGSKAGSLDYLKHFMFETTISENTFRHGFPV
jgi:RHH-type proline utilization regulon transcriptional repressor/proline dehydrogenase/delta 1-pyrroline-5-carboxylate dehydrogenase